MYSKTFSWFNFLGLCEILAGLLGLFFLVYGLYVLLVERAKVPLCSLEMLANENEVLFSQQPKLTVEVMGAVNEPGVWQFDRDDRVGKAIEVAGGFSTDVSLRYLAQQLNLAKSLTDGEKIYVPFVWEEEQLFKDSTIESSSLVSVNQATLEELMTLKGIGESRATQIIENRPYGDLLELVGKAVISEGVFADIKTKISL